MLQPRWIEEGIVMAAILNSPMLGWFRRSARPPVPPRAPSRRAAKPAKSGKARPVADIAPAMPLAFAPGAGGVDADRILAAARSAPVDFAPIEWDGDQAFSKRAEAALADASTTLENDPRGADAKTRRIRDRYITARFPGVARSAEDLESPERVIKAARLFFEDGDIDSALELLDLAIEQNSRAEALWLAQIEIVFLTRDATRYLECARAFHAMHPASEAWCEVTRLGRALAPGHSLFGAESGPREHEHYGPWPDLPNWIQANWDLTGEVVAADFHRLMKRRAEGARAVRLNPQLAA
jgi:hypothetical protein